MLFYAGSMLSFSNGMFVLCKKILSPLRIVYKYILSSLVLFLTLIFLFKAVLYFHQRYILYSFVYSYFSVQKICTNLFYTVH